MNPGSRYEDALRGFVNGNRHNCILGIANLGILHGKTAPEIIADVKGCPDYTADFENELIDAVAKAAAEVKPAGDQAGRQGNLRGDGKRRLSGSDHDDWTVKARYPYTDEKGKELFIVVRYERHDANGRRLDKTFRQEKPDGTPGVKGVKKVLYNLPAVLKAIGESRTIYLCEGEKDADRLNGLGLAATTNPNGAGTWQKKFSETMKDADVVVLADNDKAGEDGAAKKARSIQDGGAKSVKVVGKLLDAPGSDVSDFLDAGHTLEELLEVVEGTPAFSPGAQAGEARGRQLPDGGLSDSDKALWSRLTEKYYTPCFYPESGSSLNPRPNKLNEEFWAAMYMAKNRPIFIPMEKTFYEYDPGTGLWKGKSDESVIVGLKEVIRAYGGIDLYRLAQGQVPNHILKCLRGIAGNGDFFMDRMAGHRIHVANGILAFEKGKWELKPFDPKYRSRNRSETEYHEKAECPGFINQLLKTALCDEDIAILQMYFGQVLLGKNGAQKIMLLTGTAGGGKSTLVNVVERIIGKHNVCEIRVELLGERFEIARFCGRTFLTGKDIPARTLQTEGARKLKALTGGDGLDAEFKGVNGTFPVRDMNILLTSNSRLKIGFEGDEEAWKRRLLTIEYNRPPVKEPIYDFAGILVETEGPGILNWMLEGAALLIKADFRFILDGNHQERVKRLIEESDSIRWFLQARVYEDPDGQVTGEELYQGYVGFCRDKGLGNLSEGAFYRNYNRIVTELYGLTQVRTIRAEGCEGQKRGYRGLAIRPPEDNR